MTFEDPKELIKRLTNAPGVYQMFDEQSVLLYVGKAKNLKKRVSSYFQSGTKDKKTQSLVSHIHHVEVIITTTESEAYLLENNLIKQHRPRYNILLRDDKSYVFLYLSKNHDFPRLDLYRGKHHEEGQYYGPYPSTFAVRETMNLLQKLFKLRQCRDAFFNARSRPCLQYQIKRCTAPCVGYIDKDSYQETVKLAVLFLKGKNHEIIADLSEKMDSASQKHDYEIAASYRDLIAQIRQVQQQQYVTNGQGNVDVITGLCQPGGVCVQVLSIRGGRLLGSKSYFPKAPADVTPSEVLEAFVVQYYSNSIRQHEIPEKIILSDLFAESDEAAIFLSELAAKKIEIVSNVRGERLKWLEMSKRNAQIALESHLSSKASIYKQFELLQAGLKIDSLPQRIECFDISHTFGESTMASCVVFDTNGPLKSDYRRFNIKEITGGDDYAAMNQVLLKRYTKIKAGDGLLPDLLIVDGGKGQLTQAKRVLEEIQVSGVCLLGIAKGEGRKEEFDHLFFVKNGETESIVLQGAAMHLIQQIRNEAHRFAITGHRQQRDKKRHTSVLESIEGVGAKRRQSLLKHFGGLQELERASVEAIASVPGVSKELAQRIYQHFHE